MALNRVVYKEMDLSEFGFEKPTYFKYKPYSQREIESKRAFFESISNASDGDLKKAEEKFYKEIKERIVEGEKTIDGKTVPFEKDDIKDLTIDELQIVITKITGRGNIEKKS